MNWIDRIAVFDTETTGTDPFEARIVTAYVGLLDAAGNLERGSGWLADPGIEIPEQAVAVHGITTEIARLEGEPAAFVVQKVAEAVAWTARNNIALVVYNAPYDLTVLTAECRRHGIPEPQLGRNVIDPLVLDRHVDQYRRGDRKLGTAVATYGVTLMDAHNAAADAVAAGHVAQAMVRRYPELLAVSLPELHDAQVHWASEQAADFEAYMRRQRDPEFTADRGWPIRELK